MADIYNSVLVVSMRINKVLNQLEKKRKEKQRETKFLRTWSIRARRFYMLYININIYIHNV